MSSKNSTDKDINKDIADLLQNEDENDWIGSMSNKTIQQKTRKEPFKYSYTFDELEQLKKLNDELTLKDRIFNLKKKIENLKQLINMIFNLNSIYLRKLQISNRGKNNKLLTEQNVRTFTKKINTLLKITNTFSNDLLTKLPQGGGYYKNNYIYHCF